MNSTSNLLNSSQIRVLFIEDNQDDHLALIREIKQTGIPYNYQIASSLSEALVILKDYAFQVVIFAYNSDNSDNILSRELFSILKEQNCPFIIVISNGDEQIAANLIMEGASGYLLKDPDRQYLKLLSVKINKALEQYNNKFRLNLLNHSIQKIQDSIYILDTKGNLQFINDSLAILSNVKPEDVIGQSISVLKQPQLEEWLSSNISCKLPDRTIEGQVMMWTARGSCFQAMISESCIQEGTELYRVGLIRDVTSLKQVEFDLRRVQERLEHMVEERTKQLQQAIADLQQEVQDRLKIEESLRASRDQLQQQQEFFRLVIDSNPNLIFVKDGDGKFVLANKAIADFHGVMVEELLGKDDLDLNVPSEEVERYMRENRQVIATQQQICLSEEKVYRDGIGEQWQQWLKRSIVLPNSNNLGVLGVGINITNLKEIELSLRESQQRFESLAAVAPVGIFRTDINGEAVYLNERWCQIAGLTAAEAAGRNWSQALHPDDREMVAAEWYASVQEHRPFQIECRFQNKEGVTTWLLCQSAAERNIYGEIIGYVGTITDISDRKRAETVLQKLVIGTSAVTGADFFVELVRHITEALNVAYALVTEVVDGQLVSLGFWADGQLQPAISYLPAKTPCEMCMQEGQYYCEQYVQEIFSEDPDLVTMQAESYLGVALKDNLGNVIGNLCILDTKPISKIKESEANDILKVFAARASVELQRKNANEELNRLNQSLEMRVLERTQELQEREEQLRDFFDNATDLIQSISSEGRILFVNQAWKKTLGYSEVDLENLSIFDVIHPDDIEHCNLAMQRLFGGEQCMGIETRFVTKDGKAILVEGNVNCQLKDGVPVATRGIFRDVTARKQAENDLLESKRFLQLVLDTFPLFTFWKDRQSVYLGCNQNFAIGAGLNSPSEIIGKTDYDMPWGSSEAESYRKDDQQVITSGNPKLSIIETQYQANGKIMWLETNKIPLRDLNGNVIGVLGTYQDISDRKIVEESLAESEAFNRQLIEEFPIGLASCRMDGQLVFINAAFANILGRTVEETLSLSYWNITPIKYADQEAEQLRLLQTEGRYGPYEKEYIHKDGHLVPVLLSGLMIMQKGEFFIWSSVQDISDRKQVESKLHLANKELMRATRLKDEFLANMSHELRTPLNSILGMNESLQDEIFGNINERQLSALRTIENSSNHLLSLINDILDVSKIESGKINLDLCPTNIEGLCMSSLTFVRQQALAKQIQLIHNIPKSLPEIMLDERRMRQVLINLLNNAVKFTQEGGIVTLEVSLVHESSINTFTSPNYLGDRQENKDQTWGGMAKTPHPKSDSLLNFRTLRIAVIDTGIGISEENIQKLFQPFIQIDSALNRQYSGTGLGLALVKRLVELHRGNVELTSEVGIGSCFVINLPINVTESEITGQGEQNLSEQHQINHSRTERTTPPLILLAEDNQSNIVTFSNYLQARKYRLLFANDGQQAIAIAKEHRPDLILMDIQMPVMDGLEAIKLIRLDPVLADTPIIAMTALVMAGDRERCLAAGANDYLAKPFKLKMLDQMIQEFLDK